MNDDHINPNCEMKKIVCEGKPHLCLFAVKEISPGEEITYNYGDSSYPWRSKVGLFSALSLVLILFLNMWLVFVDYVMNNSSLSVDFSTSK